MAELTAAEKEKKRQSRSERAIAANDASENAAAPKKPKPKAKPKPKEDVGTGKSTFDMDAFVAKVDAQIAATDDPGLKARLKARKQSVLDNQ